MMTLSRDYRRTSVQPRPLRPRTRREDGDSQWDVGRVLGTEPGPALPDLPALHCCCCTVGTVLTRAPRGLGRGTDGSRARTARASSLPLAACNRGPRAQAAPWSSRAASRGSRARRAVTRARGPRAFHMERGYQSTPDKAHHWTQTCWTKTRGLRQRYSKKCALARVLPGAQAAGADAPDALNLCHDPQAERLREENLRRMVALGQEARALLASLQQGAR